MKQRLLYILFIVLILAIVAYLYDKNTRSTREIDRLKSNIEVLKTYSSTYRDKYNAAVTESKALVISREEFKTLYENELEQVNKLNKKLKYINSYSSTGLEHTYNIVDTVYYNIVTNDTLVDTIRCVDYNNDYINLHACVKGNVFESNIVTRDTLVQVIERIPKRFLFIKYGCKGIKQTIRSVNPYSDIKYNEYIELK